MAPQISPVLPKTGHRESNFLPWEHYLCTEILMPQGDVFSSLQEAAHSMEQDMLRNSERQTSHNLQFAGLVAIQWGRPKPWKRNSSVLSQ